MITGIVREKRGIGLPGLIVRAYDKDLLYDDLMGEDRTSCDGSFRIVSDAEDFRDFFDKRPDIYLQFWSRAMPEARPARFSTPCGPLERRTPRIHGGRDPHSIACDLPSGRRT